MPGKVTAHVPEQLEFAEATEDGPDRAAGRCQRRDRVSAGIDGVEQVGQTRLESCRRHLRRGSGRKVATGEWRDYAIDLTRDKAVFSIFRRSSEFPLFRIEKDPKLARKQGAYSVVAAGGLILKRGHDLARVLDVIDKRLAVISP